jgi:hypothetical protein
MRPTILVFALLAAGTAPAAHHPPGALYREGQRLTIDGVVVSLIYRNPHSYLHVEARDTDQQLRVWAVESDLGHRLRDPFAAAALKPGDRVIISGEPGRDDGTWRLRLRTLVRPRDGWQWREGKK